MGWFVRLVHITRMDYQDGISDKMTGFDTQRKFLLRQNSILKLKYIIVIQALTLRLLLLI